MADNNPKLLNVYLNEEATGRDHVGLFHLGGLEKGGKLPEAKFRNCRSRLFRPGCLAFRFEQGHFPAAR